MRLNVELNATDSIRLPIHYNYLIQSLIYHSMAGEFAEFLHNQGYEVEKRKFKLFTFSRLLGSYKIIGQEILFTPPVRLIISSPLKEFCQYLLNGLLSQEPIRLGSNEIEVEKVSLNAPQATDEIKIRMLSPVVAYSTFTKPDGGKYTCYFQPGEREFNRLVEENLKKKYQAFHYQAPPASEIRIKCLKPPRLHLIKYKNYVIKGYSGLLSLHGPQSLLQMALNAGLGSKNSMGFGCGELLDHNMKER